MFENLNDPNQQAKPGVDDIFSETDQVEETNSMGPEQEINTRRIGLGASNSDPTLNNNFNAGDFDDFQDYDKPKKGFTIAVVIMAVVILVLIGFLIYNKFFHNHNKEGGQTPNNQIVEIEELDKNDTDDFLDNQDDQDDFENDDMFVNEDLFDYDNEDFDEIIPPDTADNENNETMFLDSDGDGISDYDEINIYGTDPYNEDTDGDGVNDYDEIFIFGTDPVKIDTDDDGLTDYEEIFIYGTDPLNPDSDGDGYLDGEEVISGHDPLSPAGALLDLPEEYLDYIPILYR